MAQSIPLQLGTGVAEFESSHTPDRVLHLSPSRHGASQVELDPVSSVEARRHRMVRCIKVNVESIGDIGDDLDDAGKLDLELGPIFDGIDGCVVGGLDGAALS